MDGLAGKPWARKSPICKMGMIRVPHCRADHALKTEKWAEDKFLNMARDWVQSSSCRRGHRRRRPISSPESHVGQ